MLHNAQKQGKHENKTSTKTRQVDNKASAKTGQATSTRPTGKRKN